MKSPAVFRCLAALALLSVFLAIPACSHVQQVADNVCAASPELVQAVDAVVGSDDYEAQLDQITAKLCALKDGVTKVAALAGQVIANKAAVDPVAAKKYTNATAWLAKFEPPIKAGLPGGGSGAVCCFHANGGAWQIGERATDGTVVTAANYQGLCSSGRLPVRQICR